MVRLTPDPLLFLLHLSYSLQSSDSGSRVVTPAYSFLTAAGGRRSVTPASVSTDTSAAPRSASQERL